MQTARIKRGATFKATLIFDADEWAAIHPWDSIAADVGIWGRRHPLPGVTGITSTAPFSPPDRRRHA